MRHFEFRLQKIPKALVRKKNLSVTYKLQIYHMIVDIGKMIFLVVTLYRAKIDFVPKAANVISVQEVDFVIFSLFINISWMNSKF